VENFYIVGKVMSIHPTNMYIATINVVLFCLINLVVDDSSEMKYTTRLHLKYASTIMMIINIRIIP